MERILMSEWGMAVNYPKTEAAVVFGPPSATAAAMIQVGSNSRQAPLQVRGQHCAC